MSPCCTGVPSAACRENSWKWTIGFWKNLFFVVIRFCMDVLQQCTCKSKLKVQVIQYNTIQYNTIQYNTIQYNTIQYNTIQYNTIQYNTKQYNTIQYNTIHCNLMQYNTIILEALRGGGGQSDPPRLFWL